MNLVKIVMEIRVDHRVSSERGISLGRIKTILANTALNSQLILSVFTKGKDLG